MRSVLVPLFVYYRYLSKFWGTCCPLRGWSSGLDCPTITDLYRFPLMSLEPLPKAGLPPLTAGILSLCFLGSLLTYYCRCCGISLTLHLTPLWLWFSHSLLLLWDDSACREAESSLLCLSVCGPQSSPPRFVGHLVYCCLPGLLLFVRLTFAVHSHPPQELAGTGCFCCMQA